MYARVDECTSTTGLLLFPITESIFCFSVGETFSTGHRFCLFPISDQKTQYFRCSNPMATFIIRTFIAHEIAAWSFVNHNISIYVCVFKFVYYLFVLTFIMFLTIFFSRLQNSRSKCYWRYSKLEIMINIISYIISSPCFLFISITKSN